MDANTVRENTGEELVAITLESQARIQEVASKAIQIIENNPILKEAIRDTLKNNILDTILKNPMMIQSVLDEVDKRFKIRFDTMPASERLKAIKGYADLTEQLGHDIAKKTLNMPLETALDDARTRLDKKTESLKNTYHEILRSLKEETWKQYTGNTRTA